MKKPNDLHCYQCGCVIRPEDERYTILGETYCSGCGDDWMKDELAEEFDNIRGELAELLGVSISWGVST